MLACMVCLTLALASSLWSILYCVVSMVYFISHLSVMTVYSFHKSADMVSKAKPFPFINLYSIFLLFSSLNYLLQAKASSLGNETDLLSLLAIKDRIQGLISWNQSMHFCQWQGITCGKRHQRVIAVNLYNQSLVGSVSPHIGNLSFLRVINLGYNKLNGEIPPEIGLLHHLERLGLTHNALEGKIPVNLSQCTGLRMIDFEDNKLSGSIPAMLGYLSKLMVLDLDANMLTGEIPPSIGNLSSLQNFSVSGNLLEGNIPDTLGRLSSLKLLVAENDGLSGEIPVSIFNISSMDTFSVSLNNFSGNLPSDMGLTLPNLQVFFVGGNHFSGFLPVSLSNASKLEMFEVIQNNFTGHVPAPFGASQNLFLINMGDNHLGTGEAGDLSFITSLTNSSNLHSLSLNKNNFGGVVPNSISNLSTQIEKLYLGSNQLSGTIPEGIGNLVNLIALGVDDNHIQGSIPSSIGNLQNLQKLFLSGNIFSGTIPSSLGNATLLSQLFLQNNRLEGNIPLSLGRYRNLEILYAYRNNLNGSLPKEIFGIPSLSIAIDLSHNSFTGSLPVEVGSLISLGGLAVSYNKLSGKIPSSLGNCISLNELYLGNNLFEGTIPQSFSSLKNLQYLDLSSNKLHGQIPKYLVNFRYLDRLNISFNDLEGEVPTNEIFRNASAISLKGNLKLCGGIHELQLPLCQAIYAKKRERSGTFKVALAICLPVLFLVAFSLLFIHLKRKREVKTCLPSVRGENRGVTYGDLFRATDGFSPANFIGAGAFGRVYKGTLDQDEIVAVKVFNLQQKGASKSFLDECESLRNARHRNLVRIQSACSSIDYQGNDFKALVFKFLPNGSLDKMLYGDIDGQIDRSRKLNLRQRLNIAVDVASALNYLHHEAHVCIIHRDLKPSNVLLDDDMVAYIADFGIAKLLSENIENSSIAVKGSIGYAAPEYGICGEASTNGDVYSYGILLLELFTGRKPTDAMFVDGVNLHSFVEMALPNQLMEIVDPVLFEKLSEEETNLSIQSFGSRAQGAQECIASVLRIGVVCSNESPRERMNIGEVAKQLQVIRDKILVLCSWETP